jgi:hypothetical protein
VGGETKGKQAISWDKNPLLVYKFLTYKKEAIELGKTEEQRLDQVSPSLLQDNKPVKEQRNRTRAPSAQQNSAWKLHVYERLCADDEIPLTVRVILKADPEKYTKGGAFRSLYSRHLALWKLYQRFYASGW